MTMQDHVASSGLLVELLDAKRVLLMIFKAIE